MSDGAGVQDVPDLADRALVAMAVDPRLGIRLRGGATPVRDAWLNALQACVPPGTPWRRVPPGCTLARLEGGLDLAASLQGAKPARTHGLLAEAGGGVLVVAAADRLETPVAAALARYGDGGAPLDADATGATGGGGIVALDDASGSEDTVPALLSDRIALDLDLSRSGPNLPGRAPTLRRIAAARARLPIVQVPSVLVTALCTVSAALGIDGLRAPLHALRVTKAMAALSGRRRAIDDDVMVAVQLCFAARAKVAPRSMPPPAGPPSDAASRSTEPAGGADAGLHERVVAAAQAFLPVALLDGVQGDRGSGKTAPAGTARAGRMASATRGRPVGHRPGVPTTDAEFDFVATLQAAAPWQRMRGRPEGGRLAIRSGDLQIIRRRMAPQATTVFAVDASGSAAHGRLAEAKGAVELLLARCYVRRDSVALVAFRGAKADLLLPPTRSLARAKRELADLPGGGATPLAAGLDLAQIVALQARRSGREALIVLLTDGKGNVARDGSTSRVTARADALAAATAIRAAGLRSLVIDVSPRRDGAAEDLAATLAARYVPLPRGGSAAIADAVLPAPGART